jgi:hypothetical protein
MAEVVIWYLTHPGPGHALRALVCGEGWLCFIGLLMLIEFLWRSRQKRKDRAL